MIVITIELHSAITGAKTLLGRMLVINDGSGSKSKGNYVAFVQKKNKLGQETVCGLEATTLRKGRVENYPRLAYNVWRLVLRALKATFPEEKNV